jgi:AraC family transcriptional regulator of adaptative response / DNA-3-methyladenine glycosylase II
LRLAFDRPFDWPAMLKFFSARAIPGVDEVDSQTYRRTFAVGGFIEGQFAAKLANGAFTIDIVASRRLNTRALGMEIRPVFDLDAPAKHIAKHLRGDERLKPFVDRRPGLRVPGAWDGFELAVRAILGQQVSVAAASTLASRIAQKFGRQFGKTVAEDQNRLMRIFPTPHELADANLDGLGITTRRAATINGLARVMRDHPVLSTGRSLEEFVKEVADLPGFGPWTANYIAMRMGYPDAFPASDLGVRKALNTTSDKEVLRLAESWRPYRAYATMHLWASLSD